CDENLATQIEEGYLQLKAYRLGGGQKPGEDKSATCASADGQTQQGTAENNNLKPPSALQPEAQPQQLTWRLFGAFINYYAVYDSSGTAWLIADDYYGRISSTIYARLSAGQHLGGLKLTRSWNEDTPGKGKEKEPVSKSHSRSTSN